MLIASRKVERLNETATQMRQLLPEQGTAELHTVQCNIREETEVNLQRCSKYPIYATRFTVYVTCFTVYATGSIVLQFI